jgi:DNA-binding transcriptional MerR regulator
MAKSLDAFRTIGEVSEDLDVPKHVLRFWEARFPQLRPMKRGGGRRFYRPEDVELLKGIHHLLHVAGYTIRGVQKILRDGGVDAVKHAAETAAASPKGNSKASPAKKPSLDRVIEELEACLALARGDVPATRPAQSAGGRRRA